jgi:hypothetical protein
MTPPENQYQRFVSLHGFFAVSYPPTWKQETDEHGHYIFYNQSGGSGVTRLIVLENEYKGPEAVKEALAELYDQNKAAKPELLAVGKNRFIRYTKEHEINGTLFTVSYWATAYGDKVLLIAYTVQQAMTGMPTSIDERMIVEQMVSTLEFLHDTAKHG